MTTVTLINRHAALTRRLATVSPISDLGMRLDAQLWRVDCVLTDRATSGDVAALDYLTSVYVD